MKRPMYDNEIEASVCVGASRWQVAAMTVMPPLVAGAFALILTLSGEGWLRIVGFGLAPLAVWLSFWGQRQAEGLRIVVDVEGARIVDAAGRTGSMACAVWPEVAAGGLELRSATHRRPRLVLVLKDRAGRDRFQLAPDLCARRDTRKVVEAIKSRMEALGLPFTASADWP